MDRGDNDPAHEYLRQFDAFDGDSDGFVTRDELFGLLDAINLFTSPDQLMVKLSEMNMKKRQFDRDDVATVS